VAVRDERAHAEFFGEGESLAIVVFRLADIRRIFARRDLAKEPKSVRLDPSVSVTLREVEGSLPQVRGVLRPSSR
jgi:hypothetical protein